MQEIILIRMKRGNMLFGGAVVLAGLAGGLAEFIWITGYSLATGMDGWQVARAVAEAVVPAGAAWLATPALGIVIHFLLSILLAGAFVTMLARLMPRRCGAGTTVVISLIALTTVWAINFLVILPVVHPAFIHLLPYPVTLLSKLFFGLAMGWTLAAAVRRAPIYSVAGTPVAVPIARV